MKNKLIALLLGGAMVVSLLAGCGNTSTDEGTSAEADNSVQEKEEAMDDQDVGEEVQEEDKYTEKITFTMTGVNTEAGVDYDTSAVGPYIRDKFNVDFEILPNGADGAAERFAIEATSGELADLNMWGGFDWPSYYEYVNQGLFAPLPDGWEQRWPNLYNMVGKSGYLESLEVDGKTYGYLHSIYGMMTDVEVATAHNSLYLRRDLAEQVGMNDLCADDTITISELKEYLQKVKEAGLVDRPVLGGINADILLMFRRVFGIPDDDFYVDGGSYEWQPNHANYAEMISTVQEWYQEGLLDPDYYNDTTVDYERETFYSGQTPCMYSPADPGSIQAVTQLEGYEEGSGFGDVAVMCVTDDDGNIFASQIGNYWLCTVFSPNTDEATMERMLDIIDWACTEEGSVITHVGVEGSEWQYAEDGTVESLTGEEYYPGFLAYFMLGWCADDLVASGMMTPPDKKPLVEHCRELYAVRSSGTVFPLPQEYMVYSGELKTAYYGAVNLKNMAVQIICNGEDVESAIAEYKEANRDIWEPLLNDLNAQVGN